MLPAVFPFSIQRDIYWPGMRVRCWANDDFTIPADVGSWVPKFVSVQFPGGPMVIPFTVTMETDIEGNVDALIAPREAEDNARLSAGESIADLIFINDSGKPVGPFLRCPITVYDIYHPHP